MMMMVLPSHFRKKASGISIDDTYAAIGGWYHHLFFVLKLRLACLRGLYLFFLSFSLLLLLFFSAYIYGCDSLGWVNAHMGGFVVRPCGGVGVSANATTRGHRLTRREFRKTATYDNDCGGMLPWTADFRCGCGYGHGCSCAGVYSGKIIRVSNLVRVIVSVKDPSSFFFFSGQCVVGF